MQSLITESLQPLQILMQVIFNQYLSDSYCVTLILEQDLRLISPGNMVYIKLNATDDLFDIMLTVSEMRCSDYIVRMSKPKNFLINFEAVTHAGKARRSDRKIIMLPAFLDDESTLLNLLELRETAYVTDLLLVIPVKSVDRCEYYDVVTHKFAGPDSEADNPMYLDRWNACTESFGSNANLFPRKMDNLHGKTVRAAGFHYKPFTILDIEDSIDTNDGDGIDLRIIKELCRWINCTIKIIRDDSQAWGIIFDNGTGLGAIGNTFEDRADLAMSGLGAWYYAYERLDFSTYGIKCAITCIVPAPKMLSKWELPFLAFHWIMWTLLATGSVCATLGLVLTQGHSVRESLFLVWRIMVAQAPPDYKAANWKVRRITGCLILTFVIVNSAYGAGLATSFTVQKYEDSIDTIQDLIDRQMPWGAIHEAFTFTLLTSEETKIKELVKLFRKYDADTMKNKSHEKNMAFAIARLEAGTTSIGDFLTQEVVSDYMVMLEDFYIEQSLLMGRKSSPILAKVSELMLRLHETGLLIAWENQIAIKYLDYKVQVAVKYSRSKKKSKTEALGYQHVVGVFMIYLVFAGVSTVTFIIEVYIGTKKKN